jgi:hypothetical protein
LTNARGGWKEGQISGAFIFTMLGISYGIRSKSTRLE